MNYCKIALMIAIILFIVDMDLIITKYLKILIEKEENKLRVGKWD